MIIIFLPHRNKYDYKQYVILQAYEAYFAEILDKIRNNLSCAMIQSDNGSVAFDKGYRVKSQFRFFNRSEGATALEYAIVLPVLLWLVMGILEYSMVMYASAVLEGATNFAARLGKTGYTNTTGGDGSDATAASGLCPIPATQDAQTQSQFILCVLRSRVAGLLNPNLIQVNTKTFGAYDAISGMPTFSPCTSDPSDTTDPQCSSMLLGSAEQIVIYTVEYPWPVFTPFLKNVLGTNGIATLSSSALVKNEPFGSR